MRCDSMVVQEEDLVPGEETNDVRERQRASRGERKDRYVGIIDSESSKRKKPPVTL